MPDAAITNKVYSVMRCERTRSMPQIEAHNRPIITNRSITDVLISGITDTGF